MTVAVSCIFEGWFEEERSGTATDVYMNYPLDWSLGSLSVHFTAPSVWLAACPSSRLAICLLHSANDAPRGWCFRVGGRERVQSQYFHCIWMKNSIVGEEWDARAPSAFSSIEEQLAGGRILLINWKVSIWFVDLYVGISNLQLFPSDNLTFASHSVPLDGSRA